MVSKSLKRLFLLGAACVAFAAQPAMGAIIGYSDRASWLTAIGSVSGGEDFQSFVADASFDNTTIALADGMSIGTSGLIGQSGTNLIDVPPSNSGFGDLSIDGSSYAQLGSFAADKNIFIAFAAPVSAFAADFVGLNDNSVRTRIELFSGDTLLDTLLPEGLPCCTTPRFIGFAGDAGETITEMRFVFNGVVDAFGVDNIEIAEAIGEPGVLALFALGLVGLAFARRRRVAA